jgi:RNA polymerase sigma-70 factor (ECF subfamily)
MLAVETIGTSSSHSSDASLLSGVRAGEDDAASELYRRYAPRLIALARKRWPALLAGRVDPDDIIQSVFRTFFNHTREGLYHVAEGSDLWCLLAVIAVNKIRVQQTRQFAAKRDVRRTQSGDAAEWNDVLGSSDDTQMNLVVDELLESLPTEHRRVVEMRLEGYEVATVAKRIGRSKRTVERLLHECRERLQNWLPDPEELVREAGKI